MNKRHGFQPSVGLSIFIVLGLTILPVCRARAGEPAPMKGMRLPFVENRGQLPSNVAFHVPVFAGAVSLMQDGTVVYSLPRKPETTAGKATRDDGIVLRERLLNPLPIRLTAEAPAVARVNYFVGHKDRWRTGVGTFSVVSLGEAFPGISVRLTARDNTVEKIYAVAPGADPGAIRWRMEGAESLEEDDQGELVVHTRLGDIRFSRPVAWQEIDGRRQSVEIAYRCEADAYGFALGVYDRTQELLIDPLLASTFVGSGYSDVAHDVARDASNNVFVVGVTKGALYPTTGGAYDTTFGGSESDVFVSKLDASLATLLASTFIGGVTNDVGYGLAIDASNNVFVAGVTESTDFPVTAGAYTPPQSGFSEGFVVKLNNDLSELLASTRIGGTNRDEFHCVDVSPTGDVYAVGYTYSGDFPATAGAFQEALSGPSDAVVCRLDNSLSNLLAATFIGGSDVEVASASGISGSGTVYLTGYTMSSDLPVASDAIQTNFGGWADCFVGALDTGLSNLVGLTCLGGTLEEQGMGLAFDSDGNVCVVGETLSAEFPTTPGAIYTSYIGSPGYGNGFVSRMDAHLTNLLASTYMAGVGNSGTWLEAVAVDSSNRIYVAGATGSGSCPMTSTSWDPSFNGSLDVVISRLPSDLSGLDASTYLGGDGDDRVHGMILDSTNGLYVVGQAQEAQNFLSFPTTPGAHDRTHNGDVDVFVSRLDRNLSALSAPGNVQASDGDYTDKVVISWTESPYATGYEILRHTEDDSASATIIGTAAGSGFDDTTAVAGATCWYWVRGTNAVDTALSDPNYGHMAIVSAPLPPADVAASDGDYSNRVQITWTASTGADGYTLWRNTSGEFATATNFGAVAGVTADDTTAVAGIRCFYWVRATNDSGASGFNDPADAGYLDPGNYRLALELPLSVSVVSTGDAAWFVQSAVTHDAEDACQSGGIADDGWTDLRATVTGPGTVTFWWKVSSEASYDFLVFFVDEYNPFTEYGISGEVDWTEESFEIAAGTHELVWRYYKDFAASEGSDAGWVDGVNWMNCSITATAGANGAIAPTGTIWVSEGVTTNFTLTPDAYHGVDDVVVDLASVGPVGLYTFTNVTAAHTISATFKPNLATNGVPEWWLALFGWTSNFDSAAMADEDGDGLSAWEEYVAGTVPTNPLSVMQITGFRMLGASNGLEWVTQTNWVNTPFHVWRSTNLLDGTWTPVGGDITRTPPTNVWWDTSPPGDGTGFYRVVTTNATP